VDLPIWPKVIVSLWVIDRNKIKRVVKRMRCPGVHFSAQTHKLVSRVRNRGESSSSKPAKERRVISSSGEQKRLERISNMLIEPINSPL